MLGFRVFSLYLFFSVLSIDDSAVSFLALSALSFVLLTDILKAMNKKPKTKKKNRKYLITKRRFLFSSFMEFTLQPHPAQQ